MRGAADGLASPFPLAEQLPSVYREDPAVLRFAAGLDDLVAPLISVLDCLPGYFDPALAPEDFVAWLGGWTGADLTGGETSAVLRRMVAGAVTAHRRRGTLAGLREVIRLAFGAEPEITESGGANWSARPRGPLPGDPVPGLTVRLRLPAPSRADTDRLERLVASVRPAHIPGTVEILPLERSH